MRDSSTETRAANIIFMQATGDIRAEGGVRSRTVSARGPASSVSGTTPQASGTTPQFSNGPANITAEKMEANAKSGRALYSGHARLWQGDSVLEADSIELLQKSKQLNAVGKVRSVFPQAAGHDVSNTSSTSKSLKKTELVAYRFGHADLSGFGKSRAPGGKRSGAIGSAANAERCA